MSIPDNLLPVILLWIIIKRNKIFSFFNLQTMSSGNSPRLEDIPEIILLLLHVHKKDDYKIGSQNVA